MSFLINRSKIIVRFLAAAIFILVALHCIDLLSGRSMKTFDLLVDLSKEANIPTWFSSMVWFIAALSAFEAGMKWKSAAFFWNVIAVTLMLFSLDEVAMLHERLFSLVYEIAVPERIKAHVHSSIWPIAAAPFILLFIFGLVRFLMASNHVDSRIRLLIGLGFCLSLFAGWGLELSMHFYPANLSKYLWQLENIFEETLEIVGPLLIYSTLAKEMKAAQT